MYLLWGDIRLSPGLDVHLEDPKEPMEEIVIEKRADEEEEWQRRRKEIDGKENTKSGTGQS
ncbi:MAG TPA: hypothetical protein VN455_11230 [Methanotrichaceae archaeon]|nr:hypothetical protein [Methanotrichaceae archaeon]